MAQTKRMRKINVSRNNGEGQKFKIATWLYVIIRRLLNGRQPVPRSPAQAIFFKIYQIWWLRFIFLKRLRPTRAQIDLAIQH